MKFFDIFHDYHGKSNKSFWTSYGGMLITSTLLNMVIIVLMRLGYFKCPDTIAIAAYAIPPLLISGVAYSFLASIRKETITTIHQLEQHIALRLNICYTMMGSLLVVALCFITGLIEPTAHPILSIIYNVFLSFIVFFGITVYAATFRLIYRTYRMFNHEMESIRKNIHNDHLRQNGI